MTDRRLPPHPEELLNQVGWVHDLARSVVLDSQSAADAAQDALVAALESPPRAQPDEPAGLRAWLASVLRNIARTHYRTDTRRRRRELRVARGAQGEHAPSMNEMLERAELHRALVSAVLALREPYRAVVLLRFFEGFTPAEIGAQRGVSAATARSQLKRALEILRERFDEEFGERSAWLSPLAALGALAPPLVPNAAAAAISATSTSTTIIAAKGLFVGGVLMSVKTVVTALIAGTVLTAGAIYYLPHSAEPDAAPRVASREIASAPAAPQVVNTPVEPMKVAPVASTATDDAQLASNPPALVETATGSIEGVVTDKNGNALPGIVLHALTSNTPPLTKLGEFAFDEIALGSQLPTLDNPTRRAESDSRGYYRVNGLVPGGYQLIARGSNYQPRTTRGLELRPNAKLTVDVKMEEGAFVEGIVLDPDGHPVAGAAVATLGSSLSFSEGSARISIVRGPDGEDVLQGFDMRSGHTVRTGVDGRFRIEGLPLQPTMLEARHDDFAAVRREGVAPNSRDVELRLTDGGRVVGVVLDPNGKGVVGATVRSLMSDPVIATKTDDSGRFVLEHLEPGTVQLEARADGFPRKRSARLTIVDGEEIAGVEIVLEEGVTVTGLVLDPDGKPLADARLSFKRGGAMLMMSEDARTDAEGRFSAKGLRRGLDYSARATHPKYLQQALETFTADASSIDLGTVTLRRGAMLSGKVVDVAGEPLAGASVSAGTPAGELGQVEFEAVEVAIAPDIRGGPVGAFRGATSVVTTDANGLFTLAPLDAGEYTVNVRMPGYVPLNGEVIALAEGQHVGELTYTLGQGSEILGVVVNARGEPIAGAQVSATEASSGPHAAFDSHGRNTTTTSESDGSFRLAGLDASRYRVTAKFSDFAPADAAGVAAGESALKLVLLEKGSLVGVVHDAATREPVAQFSLRLESAGPGRGGVMPPMPAGMGVSFGDFGGFGGDAQEYTDGVFSKPNVNPGDYTLVVSAPNFVSAELPVRVESGRETTIEVLLEHGGAIEGFVVDRDGKPIAGASVERVVERKTAGVSVRVRAFIDDEGGDSIVAESIVGGPGQVVTDVEGRFFISGLPPGKSKLRIEHDKYMSHVTDETLVIQDLTVRVEKVTLAIGGTIRGTIFAADGTPLKRGGVTIERQAETDGGREIPRASDLRNTPRWSRKMVSVDDNGQYQQSGLVRGTYRVSAHAFDGGMVMISSAQEDPSARLIELGEDAEIVCDIRLR
ncbi:MAG: sigma-70 family RNA polymerase sigma factor [Planctomycetota bacterium]